MTIWACWAQDRPLGASRADCLFPEEEGREQVGWGDPGLVGGLSGCTAELQPFLPIPGLCQPAQCPVPRPHPLGPWRITFSPKPLPTVGNLGLVSQFPKSHPTDPPAHTHKEDTGSKEDGAARPGVSRAVWGHLGREVTG